MPKFYFILSVLIWVIFFGCNNIDQHPDNKKDKEFLLDSISYNAKFAENKSKILFLDFWFGMTKNEYEYSIKKLTKEKKLHFDSIPIYNYFFSDVWSDPILIPFEIRPNFWNDSLNSLSIVYDHNGKRKSEVNLEELKENFHSVFDKKFKERSTIMEDYSKSGYDQFYSGGDGKVSWIDSNRIVELDAPIEVKFKTEEGENEEAKKIKAWIDEIAHQTEPRNYIIINYYNISEIKKATQLGLKYKEKIVRIKDKANSEL